MCGEAVVVPNPEALPNLFTHIKLHGALMAKGWVLGLQFDTLFTDDLYFKLGKHANDMAKLLKNILKEKGYRLISAQAADLFPRCAHVESIVCLCRQ